MFSVIIYLIYVIKESKKESDGCASRVVTIGREVTVEVTLPINDHRRISCISTPGAIGAVSRTVLSVGGPNALGAIARTMGAKTIANRTLTEPTAIQATDKHLVIIPSEEE